MKQRGWLMMTGAAALTLMAMQVVAGHEMQASQGAWSHSGYSGSQKSMPGHSGPGCGYSHPCGANNGYHNNAYGMQQGHGSGHDRLGGMDLSDEQRRSIQKIMRKSRKEFRNIENKLSDKRYALYDLLGDDQGGKAAAKLADDMGDLMAERIKLRTRLRLKINKLLTSDQRDKAHEMTFFGRGWY